MDKISIIVPCYNEENALPEFYRVTSDAVSGIEGAVCEFIFVDDGSSDHTSNILESFACADDRCRYISFSRNFGKEAAMYAGLQNASGDYCVFMDADLQHPPQLLKEMYHVLKTEDYDCCAGLREDRTGENKLRSLLSRTFYKIIRKTCKLDMGDGKGDFRMMNRAMADSILELKEYNRYMKGIFSFVGFDTKWIPFHNVERTAGETKWSLRSLFRYAMDGILSFSSAPVTMAGAAGVFLILAAIVTGIWRTGRDSASHLPDPAAQRCADVLHLHSGAVCVERLYGKQETADLYRQKERGIYKYLNSGFIVQAHN